MMLNEQENIGLNTLDPIAIRDVLEDISNEYNINKWDTAAAISNEWSVQVDSGVPKQLKAAQRTSITLRVWNSDGLVGITSSSTKSKLGLKKAMLKALDASNYGNPDEIPDFKLCEESSSNNSNIMPSCSS